MKKTTKLQEALNVQSGHANTLHNYAKMLHYGRGDAMLAESLYRRILDKVSLSLSLMCVCISVCLAVCVSLSPAIAASLKRSLALSICLSKFFLFFFNFQCCIPKPHWRAA